MGALEDRLARIEQLLAEVFRPGGTFAIRDEDSEPAAFIIGDIKGDIGALLMSMGLSVKEPSDERRIVITSTGIGVKDDHDVLRILISEQGILFLDEAGVPRTLMSADGIHKVAEG